MEDRQTGSHVFNRALIIARIQDLIFGKDCKKKILENNSVDLSMQERMEVLKSEYPLETLKTIIDGK